MGARDAARASAKSRGEEVVRVAAIILGILALIAMAAGIFFYWIGAALICFDVCPSAASAGQSLSRMVLITLVPGLVVSFVAWILSLNLARVEDRSAAFLITLVAPIAVAITGAAILYIAGGSFTPVSVSDSPGYSHVSAQWVSATSSAITALVLWPLVSLITALMRPGKSRS